MPRTIDDIFNRIVLESVDKRQQGTRWERAVKFFLENDPSYAGRIERVWMWADAPTNPGKTDTGIDLVALDKDGTYWAIQAKCYSKTTLSLEDVSTFFAAALIDGAYGHFMIADSAPRWSRNLEDYVNSNADERDLVRLDLDTLKLSNLDWEGFIDDAKVLAARKTYDPRPHQATAIERASVALGENDRATVVMACGTGKTLMSLRFVETFCPNGTVLFLAPSISLVSQTMRSWVNQTRSRINVYVVCSSASASEIDEEEYGVLTDIPYPATTNAVTLASRFSADPEALNVVFSTYQSIDVIHQAQKKGLPAFDLIVCDEAHRTTGRLEDNKAENSAFVRVHDDDYVHASKRLYMTATARVYAARGDSTKALPGVKKDDVLAASMDDPEIFGPICYTLSFGEAVEKGLLTDYKLVIMQISQSMMPETVQTLAANSASEIEMPNAAKFIGIWKALFDRKHAGSVDDVMRGADDPASEGAPADDARRVLHHAIAFAANIRSSKQLSKEFNSVIKAYIDGLEEEGDPTGIVEEGKRLSVQVDHVDGSMPSAVRQDKLDWLAGEDEDGESCRILSNARCLAEGIDVPSLDAVIYLSSRKSKVDIIQSVGRVMRKAPGKEYGYIIIPVFVAAGTDPGEALAKSPEFKTIYDVVAALRSHDDRLDARINAAALGDVDALKRIVQFEVLDPERLRRKPKKAPKARVGERETPIEAPEEPAEQGKPAEQLQLLTDEEGIAKAINAQIVKRCGTKIYWSEWSSNVGKITAARADQISALVKTEPAAKAAFQQFLDGLRDSLNDSQTEQDAIDVLAQHEVTRPIFQALFDNKEVLANNPIVMGLDRAIETLYAAGLPSSINDPELTELYASVKLCVSQITTDEAKQNLIKEIYNDFFKAAFTSTADKLGIVYTPVECVDAQLHMVQRALKREFGVSLGDRGVHILDGFAGTGTYACRLIEDATLIADDDLPYKYANDIHCNEIVPLAATIMNINVEQSYHKRMGGEYKAFPGALLTDTFQMHEDGDTLDISVFTENSERIKAQLDTDITVIIGNPPYRAGDKENTGNQNTKYKTLDKRIEDTYVAKSDAINNNSLYDHYIRAFRWASDRIKSKGVVCFISNGGWLEGASMAGIRRSVVEEFNSIYVYNLRGNQRTQGEESRREGGKIFDSGSRATIAITILVKNPESLEHGQLHYRDIGDYLTRKEKLDILKYAIDSDPVWDTSIKLDKYGDWFNQRDDSFYDFAPMGVQLGAKKLPTGLFSIWSCGLKTQRDPWAWGFSRNAVDRSMTDCLDFYNECLDRLEAEGGEADKFMLDDPKISWTRAFRNDFKRGKRKDPDLASLVKGAYRPFCKQYLWYDRQSNEMLYQQPKLFPYEGVYNLEVCIPGKSNTGFDCLVVGRIPDLNLLNAGAQCFPLYWYEKAESAEEAGTLFGIQGEADEYGYIRHDAITDDGLAVFRAAYPDIAIEKEDVFFYVYGLLHSPEYRKRFESNLMKELPRIPLAKDFLAFMKAGRDLAHLHLDYETIEPWPLDVIKGDIDDPGRTEKMAWRKKTDAETGKKVPDYTKLDVAENLSYGGIPERAQDYVVNGKSALAWLVDRYKVTTDKKSGIENDPNEFSDDPRYIVDLVARVVRVSMETLDIVDSLPPLEELPQTANWPAAWRTA